MKDVLAVALTSMQHDRSRLDRVAANLANVGTTGYKRDVVAVRPFADALEAVERGAASDAPASAPGPSAVQVLTDFRPGAVRLTGRALDLAIGGEGWFEVATPSGPAYTRQGELHLDAQGRLVTARGEPVMGRAGEIRLTGGAPTIDADGNLFDPATPGEPVAQLRLVRFEEPRRAERLGDGLFSAGGAVAEVGAGKARLQQGALENANVSSMTEMVQLIETMRHFESMARVAQGYDEMLGSAIRRLGEP